ncbi:hypothetical protein BLNAU_13982 [Blattamonas nauphoetae]|uniref:Uncharacterized protein n=1 Tax=Blattamonas nauphoetae TaxID=2049346 RepID=A0ABQ9XEX4_9EUKA|nr:hypothetical protein BLNAU_13982 [Blattamonas nauphoetae]
MLAFNAFVALHSPIPVVSPTQASPTASDGQMLLRCPNHVSETSLIVKHILPPLNANRVSSFFNHNFGPAIVSHPNHPHQSTFLHIQFTSTPNPVASLLANGPLIVSFVSFHLFSPTHSSFFFHFGKAINQTPVCVYPAYRITSLQLSLASTNPTQVQHIASSVLSQFYQPKKHFAILADPFNPNSNRPSFPNRLFILFNNRHTTVHARSILRQSTALSQLATCHFANFNSLLNNALFLQFQGFHRINALPHPHFIPIANLFINTLQTSLQSLWPPTLAGVHYIEVWLRFAKLSGRGRVVFAEHPQGEQTVHSILSLSHGSFPFSFKYTLPIVGEISVNAPNIFVSISQHPQISRVRSEAQS